jgi:hypothetical protein
VNVNHEGIKTVSSAGSTDFGEHAAPEDVPPRKLSMSKSSRPPCSDRKKSWLEVSNLHWQS